MAGLADDWEENRQTCVDVLCAYLRMPYEPDPGQDAPEPQRLAFQAIREVRHTVIRVITAHLRRDAAVSWQGLNFDFTGVVFDGGDFSGAQFSGGMVNFTRQFSGGMVDFTTPSSPAARSTSLAPSSPAARSTSAAPSSPAARSTSAAPSSPAARSASRAPSSPAAQVTSAAPSSPAARSTSAAPSSPAARSASAGATVLRRHGQLRPCARVLRRHGRLRRGAEFSGGEVNFRGARFSGGAVDFSTPSSPAARSTSAMLATGHSRPHSPGQTRRPRRDAPLGGGRLPGAAPAAQVDCV